MKNVNHTHFSFIHSSCNISLWKQLISQRNCFVAFVVVVVLVVDVRRKKQIIWPIGMQPCEKLPPAWKQRRRGGKIKEKNGKYTMGAGYRREETLSGGGRDPPGGDWLDPCMPRFKYEGIVVELLFCWINARRGWESSLTYLFRVMLSWILCSQLSVLFGWV